MTIFGLLLLVLLILLLTGVGSPSPDVSRVLWVVLVILLVCWIIGAFAWPGPYRTGVYWP